MTVLREEEWRGIEGGKRGKEEGRSREVEENKGGRGMGEERREEAERGEGQLFILL